MKLRIFNIKEEISIKVHNYLEKKSKKEYNLKLSFLEMIKNLYFTNTLLNLPEFIYLPTCKEGVGVESFGYHKNLNKWFLFHIAQPPFTTERVYIINCDLTIKEILQKLRCGSP